LPGLSLGKGAERVSMESAALDERHARAGAYYFGRKHRLIHRHLETIVLEADQTASWRLSVDLELPREPDARCGEHDHKCLFLFPLLFLKKSEGRVEFGAREEDGTVLSLPNRRTCDWVSSTAATQAANRLLAEQRGSSGGRRRLLPSADLEYVLSCVCSWRSYDAFVVLKKMLNNLDGEVREIWDEIGFTQELEMLVEHSLVWVPLHGLPGERRTIQIGHGIELNHRPFARWSFGLLDRPRFWQRRGRWERRRENPALTLDTGKEKFGRRGYRISLAALGERLSAPAPPFPSLRRESSSTWWTRAPFPGETATPAGS
jgi:hypothetical protein